MQGLQVNNDAGQLLVSSDFATLHCLGKATLISSSAGVGDFPTYGGGNDGLGGRVVYSYVVTSSTAPVVFIKPKDLSKYHGLLRQYESGSSWFIEIIQNGLDTTNAPDVFCFVAAGNPYIPDRGVAYGLQVYDALGNVTFDSRKLPLAIESSLEVAPPTCPPHTSCPGVSYNYSFRYRSLDYNFVPDMVNTYSNPTNVSTGNIMFSVPAVAQSVQRRGINGYKKSCAFLGSPQYHYSYAQWWVMYRNTFKVDTNSVYTSWAPYQAAYQYWERITKSGGFAGIGGGSGDSSYVVGNTLPYTPKTINNGNVIMLIADASRYDI